MHFAVSLVIGDLRLVARGEFQEAPLEWRVDVGYARGLDNRRSVFLDGLRGETLDDIRTQAMLRLGVVEVTT